VIPGTSLQKMPQTDVYLTCRLGHTFKYFVTDTGLI
jgi:hypothetical protein